MFTISNCLRRTIELPKRSLNKQQKQVYILEALSNIHLQYPEKVTPLKPYDIVLLNQPASIQVESFDQSPLLLRVHHAVFDIPNPIAQYTVGDNALIHDFMNPLEDQSSMIVFTHLENEVCHAYLNVLEKLEEMTEQDPYVQFQGQKICGLLFTELLREHERKVSKLNSLFPDAKIKHASKDSQSGMIMKYISDHLQTVTQKEIAYHFSYQPNYFSRLCQDLFGLTFVELRTTIRLEYAKEQLSLTTKSIEVISEELGYKAVSNFHRNFKAYTGKTPAEYRASSQVNPL
ncbi:helix-turn-helix transcriptional regulator [Streptococcus sp. DD13]|uniref:helix-turn-helix transcriptional regulator n=1 Tax=Streptococcus sp. DD13 TaxID=1777881 RepID=UPI00079AA809|nr:helix-turn-helix transcriptional regulator [Streptococcus sp. DD13]KXT77329.1 Transcriptional regulator, AraC family [Streptococcus sp. DD13]